MYRTFNCFLGCKNISPSPPHILTSEKKDHVAQIEVRGGGGEKLFSIDVFPNLYHLFGVLCLPSSRLSRNKDGLVLP